MSLIAELEELQKKKAELKDELQSIEETEKTLVVRMKVLEEKTLVVRMKVLEEKQTIQVLKQRIKAKLALVEELKSKIRELENRLKMSQKEEPMEMIVEATPAVTGSLRNLDARS